MALDRHRYSALLCGLAAAAEQHPTADKLLLCQPRGVGRELLHALVRAGHPWLGFRAQTPRDLAKELAAPRLAAAALDPIDGFEELAILDEAIDEVLESRDGAVLADLKDAAGFRNALTAAIREVRRAGLEGASFRRTRLADRRKGRALAAIQTLYERRLAEQHQVDLADTLRHALRALREGAEVPAEKMYLVPGMQMHGLQGALLRELRDRGATTLPLDPVVGIEVPDGLLHPESATAPVGRTSFLYDVAAASPAPAQPSLPLRHAELDAASSPAPAQPPLPLPRAELDIDLFAAASPVDELREVLRRVMAAGVPWDDVEIVTTDRAVYGTALDSIAPRLTAGKPPSARHDPASRVTHAAGLPVSRTRIGRAVHGYLEWIREDFAEETLRRMFRDGLLRTSSEDGALGGQHAARRLRGLRIGWGRERYLRQLDWVLQRLDRPPDEESRQRRRDQERDERLRADLVELRGFLAALLDATPETPGRHDLGDLRVSPAAIAAGLMAFLDFVPTARNADTEDEAKRRLVQVLRRVSATLTRETSFDAAVAVLERFLDLRVPSPSSHGRVPWSSAGGYLHFADIDHGGLSGRPHTFVVGLDAGRFPGLGTQDALLLDSDRARLGEGLPSSSAALEERRFRLASLLAGLRGQVTLSYSAWDASEGRNLSPSPVLLQAHRLRCNDPTANYEQLHAATRPLCGPVPGNSGRIDGVDVWLAALDDNGVLRRGVDAVRDAYPGLASGLAARQARRDADLNAHKGIITPRPRRLDPRLVGRDLLLSASRLESLASCPLRYFFRYVLGLQPPDEVDFEADRWLNPLHRGSMLHSLYETIIDKAKAEDLAADGDEFAALAKRELDRAIDGYSFRVPAPSRAVLEREQRELHNDLEIFLQLVAEDGGGWLATEWEFGRDDPEAPALELPVSGGSVFLRGAIDRIDELADGRIGIVDYKTGSAFRFKPKTGTYNGGTRLQHALYAQAVERLLGREVARAEYQFPSLRGDPSRARYERAKLDRWPYILERLLDMVADGHFVPPFNKDSPCRFCDFAEPCRAREDRSGVAVSPLVEWARENHVLKPQYQPLLEVRAVDSEGRE